MKRCKGQISIFVVLGIFILLLVAVYIITTSLLNPQDDIGKRLLQNKVDEESVKNFIEYCTTKTAEPFLKEIAYNGGTLQKSDIEKYHRTYLGTTYRNVCIPHEGTSYCITRMTTREDMEQELGYAIEEKIDSCLNFSSITKQGYTISKGEKHIDVSIGLETITYKVYYPIKLIRQDTEIFIEETQTTINHPLGAMHKLMIDILNEETQGSFDKDSWMTTNNIYFLITNKKPYPYILYNISNKKEYRSKNDEINFLFGLHQNDKVSKIDTIQTQDEYGCCHVQESCFKNVDEYTCMQKKGAYINNPTCSCTSSFAGNQNQQTYNTCIYNNGTKRILKQHGESWCDKVPGIGGQDSIKTCINGEIIDEQCKDYREEVCTELNTTKAICTINRWHDCTSCDTQKCCENTMLRDCVWNEKEYYAKEPKTIECIPMQAPASRFWEGGGEATCNIATTFATCDDCDNEWVNHMSTTCAQLGDCGINRNLIGDLTTSGYIETSPYAKASEQPKPKHNFSGNQKTNILATRYQPSSLHIISTFISAGLTFLKDATENDKSSIVYSICGVWQAPLDERCEACGSLGICTEYQCHSLGQNCQYTEQDGFPECRQFTKSTKNIELNISSQNKTYIINKETKRVGDTTFVGYRVEDPLPSYAPLSFTIHTNEETQCKITYLPDLDFAESPSIWFGKPIFEKTHDVTIKLPEQLQIRKKLFENLNISGLEEFIDLVTNNSEKVQEQFTGKTKDLLNKISSALTQRAFVKDVISLTARGLDNNTYITFIRCADRTNNENKDPIYLEFTIENSTQKPEIITTSPKNNSYTSIPYNLTVYTNKPTICKWSTANEPFAFMKNEFFCEDIITPIANGSYPCTTQITSEEPIIKCQDNPDKKNTYRVHVVQDELANNTTLIDNKLATRNHDRLLVTNYYNSSSNITLITSQEYCYIKSPYKGMSAIEFNCSTIPKNNSAYQFGNYNCTAQVPELDQTYEIECITEDTRDKQTTDAQQFIFNSNSELEIVQTIPQEISETNNVELGVIINKNSKENNIECTYTYNNEMYPLYQHGEFIFKQTTYFNSGTHEIEFTCFENGAIEKATIILAVA